MKMIWLAKDSITGMMIRILLPVVIFLPCLVGIIVLWNQEVNSVDIFLFTAGSIFVLIAAIFIAAKFAEEAESKLRHSEQLSRLLVENRKDYAIFMLDPNGIIQSWNRGAERLIGYRSDEVVGKSFSVLYTSSDVQQNNPQENLDLVRKQKQVELEGWRVQKNGKRFWATITFSALFDDKHQLIGFTKLMRNTTRQKEADERLKQLVVNLEKSNQELERFAYIASHDLQEPLRMVASFTQLLSKKYRDKLDDQANEYIDFAVDGALRMQQLITDLLTYSRVSTQGKPFVSMSSKVIMENALLNLRVAIEEKKVKITYDELPDIVADDTQMLQLFQNILSNAIKFNANPQPQIHISVKREKDFWVFCLEDNGIGIAPEYHEQIFLIFQRLHGRQEYPGTGVGLAICKKIIDRHGGKIWVESEFGKGAKFCFTIPA